MVKADVKRDYYADLDLPSTADPEEIKKQFRLLDAAKQFHPDRNPGHEVDVVPKFQAVQAAHEILSDPAEKAKYDAGRAKLAARNAPIPSPGFQHVDPYGFARTNTTKPAAAPQFPFPPPPKATQRRAPFPTTNQKPQTSTGADKFNAFTRGAPSWDRAKFDEARAEAARAFPNMRPAQPTQMPPRTRQAPTAPKPSPSSETPHVPNVPPTSFSGLSRTSSARKQGYTPGAHGMDESQAPRSAYSYVQGDRRQQAAPNPHMYAPDGHNMRSPPASRARPAVSPLRHTRSSDYAMRSDQTPGSRPPSRYAAAGGEKTDLHGEGVHRSASVRNSPIDPQWEERGAFGRTSTRFEHGPRHRSASPGMRKTGLHAEFSESSSDEESFDVNSRPKAVPQSRSRGQPGHSHNASADYNPGLTGQFPSTNYTKTFDDSQYHYPPPEPREHARKAFPDTNTADGGTAKPHASHDDGPGEGDSDRPKYDFFIKTSLSRSQSLETGRAAHRGAFLNGFPLWAIPSSILPQTTPPRGRKPKSDNLTTRREQVDHWITAPPEFPQLYNNGADSTAHSDPEHPKAPLRFSAADWTDKVTADHIFRPTESQVRKSPSKLNRAASKPTARGTGPSRGGDQDDSSAEPLHGQSTTQSEDASAKSAAFLKGKLPDDWASNVKTTTTTSQAQHPGLRRSPTSDATNDSSDRYVVVEEDAMDVDAPSTANVNQASGPNGVKHPTTDTSRSSPKRRSMNGVDLKEFSQHAPFAPTSGGLKDMDDLASHLPFESRAENAVDSDPKATSRLRVLNLPRPPKTVIPPAEDRLDRNAFLQYVDNMNTYMREWNAFNAKMIEHFRSRQDRVCGTMSQNWMSQLGNGPDADILEESSGQKAGYAAYMQWLKDDQQCRHWWDSAYDMHVQCMEDLGRTREVAKKKLRPA